MDALMSQWAIVVDVIVLNSIWPLLEHSCQGQQKLLLHLNLTVK